MGILTPPEIDRGLDGPGRDWVSEAMRKIAADFNRSSDTHLIKLDLPCLANINFYLIPDVLNPLPGDIGLNFSLTDLQVSIFGFLLVLVMVLRPQGLIPERRRRLELTSEIAAQDSELVETPVS